MRAWILAFVESVAVLAVVAAAAPFVEQQKPSDVETTYLASGTGPKGSYTAAVTIVRRDRACGVRWVLADGESYYGIGLFDGDRLSVGFVANGFPGVAVYKRDGASWVGEWPDHTGAVWTEKLTQLGAGARL